MWACRWRKAISAYFQCGGPQNLANGLKCLSDHLLISGWGFDQPEELPLHGIYQPNTEVREKAGEGDSCPGGETVQALSAAAAAAVKAGRSTVGILFYRAHLLSGNTDFVDALAAEFQRRGMDVRAVYTQSLKECDAAGRPLALGVMTEEGPVDAVVSTLSFALGDGGEVFSELDLPVFQAIYCSNERAAWERNGRGLGSLDTAMNVAIPEFDGRIVGTPVSFKEALGEGGTRYVPDGERIGRLAGIVEKHIALRHKANSEKRIAVVLTQQLCEGGAGGQCGGAGRAGIVDEAVRPHEESRVQDRSAAGIGR